MTSGGREKASNACRTATDEHFAVNVPAKSTALTMIMPNFFRAGPVLPGNSLGSRLFDTLAAAARQLLRPHSRRLDTMLSLWRLTWIVYSPLPILAALVNVSIDDTQFTYQPAAAWNVGGSCQGCTAHPDVTQFYGGTWHDGTVYQKYSVLFTLFLTPER